jgi:hypothetical protein
MQLVNEIDSLKERYQTPPRSNQKFVENSYINRPGKEEETS